MSESNYALRYRLTEALQRQVSDVLVEGDGPYDRYVDFMEGNVEYADLTAGFRPDPEQPFDHEQELQSTAKIHPEQHYELFSIAKKAGSLVLKPLRVIRWGLGL